MIDEKQAFSDRLNQHLDEIGYPMLGRQTRLGHAMGVSQKGAAKWLNGTGIPGMDNAIKLAKLIDIDVEYLLTGKVSGVRETTKAYAQTQPNEHHETELLELYASLNQRQQDAYLEMLRAIVNSQPAKG